MRETTETHRLPGRANDLESEEKKRSGGEATKGADDGRTGMHLANENPRVPGQENMVMLY
eukprot:COSAG02_NODE_2762_length_8074_cov_96.690408_8_plen_60_part_00